MPTCPSLRLSHAATLAVSLLTASWVNPLSAQTSRPAPSRAATDSARHGVYDIELTTDGGTIVGTLAISRATAGRTSTGSTAQISLMDHSPTTTKFARGDSAYVLEVAMGDTKVTYSLVFVADSVRGRYSMSSGGAGRVLGVRRK